MLFYYLTGPQYALSNLALRRVKISRFADLNDPFELLAVDIKDRGHRRAFRDMKEEINKKRGLICLSRSWSNPVLWGHYAEKHTGIALGFEVDPKKLAEVIYAEKPLKIAIDKDTNLPVLTKDVISELLRTKFHDWKYEEEMRLFVELANKKVESGQYFHDFSKDFQLREVILGPKCELPIASVRAIVDQYSSDVEVKKARIAFSSFSVVKDKTRSKLSSEV